MQPPCFLLKRYLEVNPAFYRTSPLSFLVTPPVTFSHWLLALAASFDASCRLNHTTPPVVLQPLSDAASWCLLLQLPTPPLGVFPRPFRCRLLVSSLVSLSAPPPWCCYYPLPCRAASWRHGSPKPRTLASAVSQPCLSRPCPCSAPLLRTPFFRFRPHDPCSCKAAPVDNLLRCSYHSR